MTSVSPLLARMQKQVVVHSRQSVPDCLPRHLSERDGFCIRWVAFGPAPTVTEDLAKRFPDFETVIRHHDPVPRLSYGSVMDLKELVLAAGRLRAANPALGKLSPPDTTRAFDDLDRTAARIAAQSPNLKLVCAGSIVYLHPSATSTPVHFSNPITGRLDKLPKTETEPRLHLESWSIAATQCSAARIALTQIPVLVGVSNKHGTPVHNCALARAVR
ncbi:hypothetical protein RI367_006211 [Sorochytrium milnesiophthora]